MQTYEKPSKPEPFKIKRVNYKVKYHGEMTLDLTPNSIYQCIGEVIEDFQQGFLVIIDESGDSYIYAPKYFEKIQ